jgi:hypothetical protein
MPHDFVNIFNDDFSIFTQQTPGPGVPAANLCEPASIYGPYQQTLFLGCSVINFSAGVGWNEQVSELTVQLVEDPCVAPANRPKVYWSSGLSKVTTTDADPGFLGESLNIIGSPAYFRVGDFEFTGIIQSWDKQNSTSGKPVYVVKLVDPREILQGINIIIGDYSGPIFNTNYAFPPTSTSLSESLYNVVNAFGYAEQYGINCPATFQLSPGYYQPMPGVQNPWHPYFGIDGIIFGTPAGGYGGAQINQNGMRWNDVKHVVNLLINGVPRISSPFAPWGRAIFHGITGVGQGYGSYAHLLEIGRN